MSRDWRLFLDDIVGACLKIVDFTREMDLASLADDSKTRSALERELFVLGEAAKHIPAETRDRHPDVPWREMAGLRDVLAHAYFELDDEILWDVARTKVPDLLEVARQILSEADSPQ